MPSTTAKAQRLVRGCYPAIMDMASRVSLRSVVLDCADTVELATFYARLLGGRLAISDPQWCEFHLVGPPKLAFQRVEQFRPPDWPHGTPQQLHLDVTVADLEGTSRRAVELGARVIRGPIEEPGCTFIVHADPAGHPFCLCEERPPG